MTLSLLATKFFVPHLRPDLISRPRLMQKLSDGLARPVVLISAPAGFGKTTLLSTWHHSPFGKAVPAPGEQVPGVTRDWSLAWLSLEKEDNAPARFLDYLAVAFEPWLPGLRVRLREQQPDSAPHVILTKLLEHLEHCATPLVLILEDYHVISTKAIHEMVAFLVQHRPACLRFIISTRSDPPLPLARWRLQDELVEIRADDLRFTHEEMVTYLKNLPDAVFPDEAIATLETRTEGWIAGIKLAALSLRNTPQADIAEFVRTLSGNHRLIADYLLEEVIESQPEAVRHFLLQTSILPSLAGMLCDAVTGQQNGQEMLELLERENLFVVQLDNERVWYRYHHLFADLLRQKLEQRFPGGVNELRRRAAEWYAQNDYPECAIDEALEIRDFRLAADWLNRMHRRLLENSLRERVVQWVAAIPEGILAAYPELDRLRVAAPATLLTQREQDVLRQIAAGASNQEIAAALVISLGTVKKHLNNIFAKLNARNRTQALAHARELGLL